MQHVDQLNLVRLLSRKVRVLTVEPDLRNGLPKRCWPGVILDRPMAGADKGVEEQVSREVELDLTRFFIANAYILGRDFK